MAYEWPSWLVEDPAVAADVAEVRDDEGVAATLQGWLQGWLRRRPLGPALKPALLEQALLKVFTRSSLLRFVVNAQ